MLKVSPEVKAAPANPPSIDNLPGYGETTGRLIQRRIASKLEYEGLHQASWDEADLHVSFSIGGQTYKQADDSVADRWADPTLTEPEEHVDGSLVIEMAEKPPEIRFDTITSSSGVETIEKARTHG